MMVWAFITDSEFCHFLQNSRYLENTVDKMKERLINSNKGGYLPIKVDKSV